MSSLAEEMLTDLSGAGRLEGVLAHNLIKNITS